MGHKRRFSQADLESLVSQAGLQVESAKHLNKISMPVWWLSSRLLRVGRIKKPFLKLFDKSVWLWKRVNPILPWNGLNLIVVARRAPQ
jgi:hypothetical protein